VNTHLTDDELIVLVDDGISHEHLSVCSGCRSRHAEFAATLTLASKMPAVVWSPLRGETLVHRVRRRLRDQRGSHRPAWQPALGGSVVTVVVAAGLMFVMGTRDLAPELAFEVATEESAWEPLDTEEVVTEGVVTEQVEDTELAEMIETYLMETASADQLLLELDELSDDEYYALLEE
jgi:hypothetical protein